MFGWNPASFSLWDWWLYAFAAYSGAGLIWFWFKFRRLEQAAKGGGDAALQNYRDALEGFPNAVYAKMLGKRALEADEKG